MCIYMVALRLFEYDDFVTCEIKNIFLNSFLSNICLQVHWTQIQDTFKPFFVVQENAIFVKRKKKKVVFPYDVLI